MYLSKPTRRDFLASAGTGLVAIAQAVVPDSLAAQNKAVNGFNGLRAYGVNLYNETKGVFHSLFPTDLEPSASGIVLMNFSYLPEQDCLDNWGNKTCGAMTLKVIAKDLSKNSYSVEMLHLGNTTNGEIYISRIPFPPLQKQGNVWTTERTFNSAVSDLIHPSRVLYVIVFDGGIPTTENIVLISTVGLMSKELPLGIIKKI